jgi:hypothetical protein
LDYESLWLKENYFIYIGDPINKFYKITRREAFEFETGREDTAIFSAVSSGSESGYKNIDILEPDETPRHLFQVLWGVKDTLVRYYLKLPTGTNRFGTDEKKDIGYINAERSPYYAPNPDYMFWLVNDWYPSINAVNESPVTITPKIWFRGMKYDIEEVKETKVLSMLKSGQLPHRKITLGGIKTSE